MRYLTGRTAWVVFAFSIVALALLGYALVRATAGFAESAKWVSHTHEVETAISHVRADIAGAESGRLAFVLGDEQRLSQYDAAIQLLPGHLRELQQLSSDNQSQQLKLDALSPLLTQKLDLMQQSVALHQNGKPDQQEQLRMTRLCGEMTTQANAILDTMKVEEQRLLLQRNIISEQRYRRIQLVLALAFVAIVLLLVATIQSVLGEVKDRRRAEAAVRRLSSRILELQDVERRKVARELHDSIGQYFAALQMNLSVVAADLAPAKKAQLIADCQQLVEQGMAETRTLSHLLHPPLLDEAGFSFAARWYVDGFSERSKINVTLEIPENMARLPREVELVLFRVLQEGLTNIHKHSGSRTALVRILPQPREVTLTVTDEGKGIPAGMIEEFNRTTAGTGIGLAGMRERVHDLGGELELRSLGLGTELRVTLRVRQESSERSSGPLHPSSPALEPDQSDERADPYGLRLEGLPG